MSDLKYKNSLFKPINVTFSTILLLIIFTYLNALQFTFYNFKTTAIAGGLATYLTSLILILSNNSFKHKIIYITPSFAYMIDQLYEGLFLTNFNDFTIKHSVFKILVNFSICFAVINYCFSLFTIRSNKVKISLTSFILVIILIVGSGMYIENWFSFTDETAVISIIKDTIILISIFFLLFTFAFIKPFNFQQSNPIEALKIRFKSAKKPEQDLRSFLIIFFIALLSLLMKIRLLTSEVEYDLQKVVADLSFFYFAFPAIIITLKFKEEFRTNKVIKSLASSIDPRLIKRVSKSESRTTTLSFPSFIYTLDNDPGLKIIKSLPATITLIRNEEFKRCLKSLVEGRSINDSQLGSRYYGAINPENSPISGLEALCLFANIHLEAVPLIERRIVGLCRILPILDPDLAQKADVMFAKRKLSNQGIFYFLDYNWIDQHLSKSNNLSTYGTSFEPLPGYLRESILNYEKNNLDTGSFIWLTLRASQQIKRESPALGSIIQETPITLSDGTREIFFTIKIEKLLPLLNHYEIIERGRQILSDYEPTNDSIKLREIIKRRISLARSQKEMTHIIEAVLSYKWSGYTEKDMAIELLLLLWETKASSFNESNSEAYNELKNKIIESIFTIGYPSKHFHGAQLQKQAIREISKISEVVINQDHPQFNEAWILLAGGIRGRLQNKDLPKILTTLNYTLNSNKLMSNLLVQYKLLDCLTFVLPTIETCPRTEIFKLFNKYIHSLTNHKFSRDQMIQITDRIEFLTGLEGWPNFSDVESDKIIKIFVNFAESSEENISQFLGKIRKILEKKV